MRRQVPHARLPEQSTPCQILVVDDHQHFDIVLLDLMMPETDGIRVLREFEALELTLRRIIDYRRLKTENADLRRQVELLGGSGAIIARSKKMADLKLRRPIRIRMCCGRSAGPLTPG